jgi:hypothetical protein
MGAVLFLSFSSFSWLYVGAENPVLGLGIFALHACRSGQREGKGGLGRGGPVSAEVTGRF